MNTLSFERGRTTTFDLFVASSTTGAPLTGKVKADFQISKDGAAFAALNASTTVTEIGQGVYAVVLHASTDATCDRFVVTCVAASTTCAPVFGRSQWEFSKVRIESSVSTQDGSGRATDAPLFVSNTYAGSNGMGAAMFQYAGAGNNANGIYIANFAGWGNGIGINNSAIGISLACTKGIDQTWGTTFLSISGSPGATGGKLVTWQTLGGTAPTGPIFDFGASMGGAKIVDATFAAAAPIFRLTSSNAQPLVNLINSSTGDVVKLTATGAAAYALNLDHANAAGFCIRIDGNWPLSAVARTGWEGQNEIAYALASGLPTNRTELSRADNAVKVYQPDGTTLASTRGVTDDGATSAVAQV